MTPAGQTHSWQECEPAMLRVNAPWPDPARIEAERANAALREVWASMTDEEHRMFHEYTCWNNQDEAHLRVIYRMRKSLEARLPPTRRSY